MDIEQFEIKGKDYTRNAWFLPGPDHPHRLCVILDGEYYLKMNTPSILKEWMASVRIPKMSVLLLSHNGAQSRHDDYTCNDRFARYVAEDVMAWAKNQISAITGEGNLICGLSLSGLASAHIALSFPLLFSASLCQSGAFWWNRNHFASLTQNRTSIKSRFWLSVGDKETSENVFHPPTNMHQEFSQIAGVQAAVAALKDKGANVHYHLFHGGHEFGPWTDELGDALEWCTT